jgi:hypothetical protein
MSAEIPALSPEERGEWSKLLSDALNGSRRVDAAAIDRAELAVREAERKRLPWVGLVLRAILREGLRKRLSRLSKSEAVVLMANNGSPVATTTRIGVRRRRSGGVSEPTLEALSVVTWEQVEAWLTMIESQVAAALVNRAKAAKLLTLHKRFPDSIGPGDACEQLGTTVEAFLTEDPAA